MKNKVIIIGFILLFALASAYEKIYYTPKHDYFSPYQPYSAYSKMYCSPYRYLRNNSNDSKKVKRLHNIIRLQRLKNNYLTWDTFQVHNPWSKGKMTGYSVPVDDDIYNQMGIKPLNTKNNSNIKHSLKNQELYSTPSGDESYSKNGMKNRGIGGIKATTGVTIIYD